MRPIVYTITPFTTTRCFEQIRVDVCYQQSPVIIVGTGSGLSYAELGPTHHSLEDFGIMRTLPGMQIVSPCDATELRLAMRSALQSRNPTYIRIGKKGEPAIHPTIPSFSIGKAITIRHGKKILMLVTGTIMSNALAAAELLESQGISTQVASVHTIKPFDENYLNTHINNFDLIATVEEHGKSGGLGGIVSELLSNKKSHPRHIRIGTPDEFMHEMGSQKFAQKKYGLDPIGITSQIALALKT